MGDKAELIICAAREAFLEKGYDGVSMDEVASRAGVAKQTVYARYASKDALFLAVCESLQGRMLSAISAAESLPIRDRLQQIARELLELVLDPSSLSLSRIALGASYRFPTLGHSIYGARINKLHEILACILEQAAQDGCLAVSDPRVAAEQFLALVRANSTSIAYTIQASDLPGSRLKDRSTRGSIASWPDTARPRSPYKLRRAVL
jgi:TetR/AcrR family transcriptional regulator, mexJK operon transcriptional repressor